jgi:hypothetical protein
MSSLALSARREHFVGSLASLKGNGRDILSDVCKRGRLRSSPTNYAQALNNSIRARWFLAFRRALKYPKKL